MPGFNWCIMDEAFVTLESEARQNFLGQSAYHSGVFLCIQYPVCPAGGSVCLMFAASCLVCPLVMAVIKSLVFLGMRLMFVNLGFE